jgi:serine protease Do
MRYHPCRIPRRTCWASLRSIICVSLASAVVAGGVLSVEASNRRRSATVLVVQKTRPSVVNIHGQKLLAPGEEGFRPGEQPQRVNGMGTGVVIDERGYIITNLHVVEGVKKIEVTLHDEKTYTATLISHDPKTDLAIIRITTPDPLPVITIGTSSDLMPGESVIAIGNAFGYEHTVTEGIISALHRRVQVSDAQSYNDLIQTSASINPGNSGGPLLNIDGEMIGINVAVRAGAQGIGFAIPVDMAMQIATELLSAERLNNTWHGVVGKEQLTEAGRPFVVSKVEDDSPADKSDLQPGDTIKEVADRKVVRALDLERALLGRKAGEEVEVTIERNGATIKTKLALVASPRTRAGSVDHSWDVIGLKLSPMPVKQFREMQSRYRGGLAVLAVRPESPAARQGIRRGDVLVGMHVWETVTIENVNYILNRPDFTSIDPVKFYILRGNETLYGHMTVSLQK